MNMHPQITIMNTLLKELDDCISTCKPRPVPTQIREHDINIPPLVLLHQILRFIAWRRFYPVFDLENPLATHRTQRFLVD